MHFLGARQRLRRIATYSRGARSSEQFENRRRGGELQRFPSLGRLHPRGIDDRLTARAETHVATVAPPRAQRAQPSAVAGDALLAQTLEHGGKLGEHLRTVTALTLGLERVVAHRVAPASLSIAHRHLLDLEVVRHRTIASGARDELGKEGSKPSDSKLYGFDLFLPRSPTRSRASV